MKVIKSPDGRYVIDNGSGAGDSAPKPRKVGSADYITARGTVNVSIRFDTGTKVGVSTDDIFAAIKNTVAALTGATDVMVTNSGGAVLIGTKAVA